MPKWNLLIHFSMGIYYKHLEALISCVKVIAVRGFVKAAVLWQFECWNKESKDSEVVLHNKGKGHLIQEDMERFPGLYDW